MFSVNPLGTSNVTALINGIVVPSLQKTLSLFVG